MANDTMGNAFVFDRGNGAIRRVDAATGKVTTIKIKTKWRLFSKGLDLDDLLPRIYFMAAHKDRGLVVSLGNAVAQIGLDGILVVVAGDIDEAGDGDGPARAARFNAPFALAVAENGDIFVCDSGNHTVRRLTPSGEVSTVAGVAHQRALEMGTGGLLDAPHRIAILGPTTLALISRNALLKLSLP
jgi:streptogramin lyase